MLKKPIDRSLQSRLRDARLRNTLKNVGLNADAADKNVCATMQKRVFGGTKPNIDFAF
ncbi:MAG: hypothetical protein ACLQBJ_15115 [Bryobacteraceae bacterium]